MSDNTVDRLDPLALAELHFELAELEAEIVRVERQLDDLRARTRIPEQRAMTAIRAGDDLGAKAALEEMRQLTETVAPLEADLKVLRAITSEYRRALDSIDVSRSRDDV